MAWAVTVLALSKGALLLALSQYLVALHLLDIIPAPVLVWCVAAQIVYTTFILLYQDWCQMNCRYDRYYTRYLSLVASL